jgi:hypothetical protein
MYKQREFAKANSLKQREFANANSLLREVIEMIKRPESNEFSPVYAGYIKWVPGDELLVSFKEQLEDTISLLSHLTEEKAIFRYAPNKWSIKEMIGHIADAERIMSYRLLCIARGDDTPLPGFEEDDYVLGASFDLLPFEDLLDNLIAVRKSTLALLKGIAPEAYLRMGTANNKAISARAIAFIISGHELHHRNVLVERYLL